VVCGCERLYSRLPAICLFAALSLVAGKSTAIPVEGFTYTSDQGLVSMQEGHSPLQTGDTLERLAAEYGPALDAPGDSVIINDIVHVDGDGGISAVFGPDDAQRITGPDVTPWESVPKTARDSPLQLLVQPPTAAGSQNLLIGNVAGFYPELPDLEYVVGGLLDGTFGGALSLYYGRPQTAIGFTLVGLDPNQITERFVLVHFYDLDGSIVDSLTVTIPFFSPPDPTRPRPGTATLAFDAIRPFWGITITTTDFWGLGIGDFAYNTASPAPWLSLLTGILIILWRKSSVVSCSLGRRTAGYEKLVGRASASARGRLPAQITKPS
jgi:hypothetical protein